MSKWDEQFDFDDFDSKPKKGKEAKRPNKKTDDFFELDEEPASKAPKLPVINKKTIQTPNNKNSKDKTQKKSQNVYDDYEEIYEDVQEIKSPPPKDSKKHKEESYQYEEVEDVEQIVPKKQPEKNLKNQPKKDSDEEQYYQEIQQISPPKDTRKVAQDSKRKSEPQRKIQQKEEQDYEQNFDDYGQDFEEQVKEEKNAEIPKKSATSVNLKPKDKSLKDQNQVEDKKYSVNTNKAFVNKQPKLPPPPIPKQPQKENKGDNSTVSKKTIQPKANPGHGMSQPPKQIPKSSSRKSLKSNDSKSNAGGYSRVSKVSRNNVSLFTPNKHINLVEKTFPDQDQKLNAINIDRLSRMNQQVRDMIRKFNEELNQLINKNMILLKEKPTQKQKSIDDKCRLLEEQLRSGATAIEVIENEYLRLKGREGELREEQYQLIMQKKIEECKQQTKQTAKAITKLKFEMNNDGNKLSKHQIQKKMAQQLHQIKTMLIQAKKQQEKNETKISKLDAMIEELDGKNNDKQYELSEQIDSAKQKGLVFGIKEETRKKYQDLKARVMTTDNHRKCMQGLYKNKCDIVVHQNQQIKITIKSIQSQINNLAHSIQHEQEQSKKIIKKTKENSRLSVAFIQSLDKLLKSIQQSQNSNLFEIRTEGNKSQASQRPLKTSMIDNVNKEKPTRNSASKKQQTTTKTQPHPQPDEINLMKPNFMKKKQKTLDVHQKQEQKTNRMYEQVWNQEEQLVKKQQQRKKDQQKKKEQQRIKEEEARKEEMKKAAAISIQEQKKKPFTLKKNRMNQEKPLEQAPQNKPQQTLISPKLQIPTTTENTDKKQEDKPTIGPRMMRFNKKERNNNDTSKNEIVVEAPKEELKIVKQQPIKLAVEPPVKPVETEQPLFMPKRFNMRNRVEKKEQSYVPTLQTKAQEKKEEKKEYNPPNFSTKNEEITKIPIETKKIQNDTNLDTLQQKPKFTLRLRDRQKKENNEPEYMPTRLTQVADDKAPKNHVNPSISNQEPKKQEKNVLGANIKKEAESSYQPTFKAPIKQPEKENNLYNKAQTKQLQIGNKDSFGNPYAPLAAQSINAREKQVAPAQINNPYAPKQDMPKRERQGPVKKLKIQNKQPKQKFNIYEQAEDITEPVSQPPVVPTVQPTSQKPTNLVNMAKTNELDLNAMLGINKKDKSNDLEDLLGEIKIDKKKEKKKNNDFFNDLEL